MKRMKTTSSFHQVVVVHTRSLARDPIRTDSDSAETTADLEEGEEADNGQSDLSHAAVPTPVDPNTPIRNRTRAFKRAREDDGKAADGLKSPPAKRAANIDAEKTT